MKVSPPKPCFGIDHGKVKLNGALAEIQFCGHFLGDLSREQACQHLAFALREPSKIERPLFLAWPHKNPPNWDADYQFRTALCEFEFVTH